MNHKFTLLCNRNAIVIKVTKPKEIRKLIWHLITKRNKIRISTFIKDSYFIIIIYLNRNNFILLSIFAICYFICSSIPTIIRHFMDTSWLASFSLSTLEQKTAKTDNFNCSYLTEYSTLIITEYSNVELWCWRIFPMQMKSLLKSLVQFRTMKSELRTDSVAKISFCASINNKWYWYRYNIIF